jgi:hypothetical protein
VKHTQGNNVRRHGKFKIPAKCKWTTFTNMKVDCFAITGVEQKKDILLFFSEVVWKDLLFTSTGIQSLKHNSAES